MKIYTSEYDRIGKRNPMIYGQFLEHFHRQIYGGVMIRGINCRMKTDSGRTC